MKKYFIIYVLLLIVLTLSACNNNVGADLTAIKIAEEVTKLDDGKAEQILPYVKDEVIYKKDERKNERGETGYSVINETKDEFCSLSKGIDADIFTFCIKKNVQIATTTK